MPIPEDVVSTLVIEVSERMTNPTYAQVAIGTFVQAHPDLARYITAQTTRLGDGEAVMHAVFHAQFMHECFSRHRGRGFSPVGFVDLDDAYSDDAENVLHQREPALADYLRSNVESTAVRKLVANIALTFERQR